MQFLMRTLQALVFSPTNKNHHIVAKMYHVFYVQHAFFPVSLVAFEIRSKKLKKKTVNTPALCAHRHCVHTGTVCVATNFFPPPLQFGN